MNPMLRAVLATVLSALVIDFTAYLKRPDKGEPFDWKTFGFRMVVAVASGLLLTVGAPASAQ